MRRAPINAITTQAQTVSAGVQFNNEEGIRSGNGSVLGFQNVVQGFKQRLDRHRFAQDRRTHVRDESLEVRIIRQPGDEDKALRQGGIEPFDRGKKHVAFELGHFEVADHGIHFLVQSMFERQHSIGDRKSTRLNSSHG